MFQPSSWQASGYCSKLFCENILVKMKAIVSYALRNLFNFWLEKMGNFEYDRWVTKYAFNLSSELHIADLISKQDVCYIWS